MVQFTERPVQASMLRVGSFMAAQPGKRGSLAALACQQTM